MTSKKLGSLLRKLYCSWAIISQKTGMRCTLLHEGTDVHIQKHNHQKDLNLCMTLYYYAKVTAKLGKTQTRNSTLLWCL